MKNYFSKEKLGLMISIITYKPVLIYSIHTDFYRYLTIKYLGKHFSNTYGACGTEKALGLSGYHVSRTCNRCQSQY